jgi:hypothetical protein
MSLGTQLFLILMAFIIWRAVRILLARNKAAKEEHEKNMAEYGQYYSPLSGLDFSPPPYRRIDKGDTFPPS